MNPPRERPVPRWLLLVCAALCALSSAGLIACLKALPYSTSVLARVEREEAERPPASASFSVGPLRWDLALYRRDPSLEPLREFKRRHCRDHLGVEAALCLSDAMARQFPFGAPRAEFVDADYDLLTDFEEHLSGAPGHCVTRSGLVSATLLASGIAARVAQFVPPRGGGHNVLEVWSEGEGWVMVDPSLGGTASDGKLTLSATAVATAQEMRWQQRGRPASPGTDADALYGSAGIALLPGSDVLFPEPWLYTRTGLRLARWPFRGTFAVVDGHSWDLGPAQRLCRTGAIASALLGLALVALAWRPPRHRS